MTMVEQEVQQECGFQVPVEQTLCCVWAGGRRFALETASIREVLAPRPVKRVPLAPWYVAGMVSYGGDLLTTLSLGTVLGGWSGSQGCILVMDGDVGPDGQVERFGLEVEAVGRMMELRMELEGWQRLRLPDSMNGVCRGALLLEDGPLVLLDVEKLKPRYLGQSSWLSGSAWGVGMIGRDMETRRYVG